MSGGEAAPAVEGGEKLGTAVADAAMDGEIDAEASPKVELIVTSAVKVEEPVDPEDNRDFS
jgi:hypothetical protein